jgi:hypothetical protein
VNALPDWLPRFAHNLLISATDGRVWLSIAVALMVGGLSLALGVWVTRRVGLLDRDAPAGETIGVGLAAGLLLLVSFWAAIGSGGRSVFVPVAIAFAAAIGLARRIPIADTPQHPADEQTASGDARANRVAIVRALLNASIFVVVIGLIYGATMAPSPQDGRQPVEFMDQAYYSVLGRDLSRTGTESFFSPAGFDEIPGLPDQTWYHWGDIWLTAIPITVFGLDPVFARHYVALPLLLLAAAALTGTLVRRFTRTTSRVAFLFGASASVFLAPIPLPVTFYGGWARGLIFAISSYGLAVVTVLLALYLLAGRGSQRPSTARSLFAAGVVASVVPGHILMALLGLAGAAGVLILRGLTGLTFGRQLPEVFRSSRPTLAFSTLFVATTVGWGLATGHGIGASGASPNVPSFSVNWRESVALTAIGFGPFLVPPLLLAYRRHSSEELRWVIVGGLAVVVAGGIMWGALLGDFNMFHVFFGGIAAFAIPVAVIAIWALWVELRERRYVRLGMLLLALSWAQIAYGVIPAIQRLQQFGPYAYEPIPVALLDSIRQLPAGAKLAYSCNSMEEIGSVWDPRLISIDAHADHRVVPMCFQAEVFGALFDEPVSPDVINPWFLQAPQRAIYPDSHAEPSLETITAFLKTNGIGYIYADAAHPNRLVPAAVPIATSGNMQVLQVP